MKSELIVDGLRMPLESGHQISAAVMYLIERAEYGEGEYGEYNE